MNQDNNLNGQNNNDFYSPQPQVDGLNNQWQQPVQSVNQPMQSTQQTMYQQPVQQPVYQQPMQQPMGQVPPSYQQPKGDGNKVVLIAFLAILVFVGIIGIVFGKIFKKSDKVDEVTTLVYEGAGYSFKYKSDWEKNDKGLVNSSGNTLFAPIGISAFDAGFSCDFDDKSCKDKVYSDFYDMWNEELIKNSLVLIKNNTSFEVLVDDINIAYYDYGKDEKNLRGRYYLIVSKDKNVLISFISNTNKSIESVDDEIREMLKTLDISKKELTNAAKEREIAETLDTMSNWNVYSSKRNNSNISRVKGIEGGWRLLSDSDTYWTFNNGEFYWYKDYKNLNDNYWYGTYTYLTGKEGLKSVGIDESKLDTIIKQSNGRITADDVYALVLTPQKIISDGQDKTSTNLQSGTLWKLVWIIVDHGNDGIEAQVLNVNSADTNYYFKVIS